MNEREREAAGGIRSYARRLAHSCNKHYTTYYMKICKVIKWTPNERTTTILRGLMIRSLCFENERCVNRLKLFQKCSHCTLWYALSVVLNYKETSIYYLIRTENCYFYFVTTILFYPEVLQWKCWLNESRWVYCKSGSTSLALMKKMKQSERKQLQTMGKTKINPISDT